MSAENVFNFLETTLLDLDAREAAQRNFNGSIKQYSLTPVEQKNIERRMVNRLPEAQSLHRSAMQNHYESIPFTSTEVLSAGSVADRLATVDQTFDVKPIVVITTTTTTITMPTPSPTPSPSPGPDQAVEDLAKALNHAVREVEQASEKDRLAKLMKLALVIEASAT